MSCILFSILTACIQGLIVVLLLVFGVNFGNGVHYSNILYRMLTLQTLASSYCRSLIELFFESSTSCSKKKRKKKSTYVTCSENRNH